MKECTKCKQCLDAKMFSSHKRAKSGLSSWCRRCVSEYNKSGRNKVKARERSKKHRRKAGLKPLPKRTIEMVDIKSGQSNLLTCSLCKLQKTLSHFSPSIKPANSFSSWCKKCQLEAQANKRRENRKTAPFAHHITLKFTAQGLI